MSRFAPSNLLAALLVLSLFLQACATLRPGQTPAAKVTLRVVQLPYLTFAPFFIAQEEGFFTEQGLEIEYVKLERTSQAIPLLTEGKLDVLGGAVDVGTLNFMARGARIRIVADRSSMAPGECDTTSLLARADLVKSGGLNDVAQLKGRKVAGNATTINGYYMTKLLAPVGLTLKDIEMIDLPQAAKPDALARGSIDVVAAAEPELTRLLELGSAVVWKKGQDVIPDFQLGYVLYGPSLLDQNPDAGNRFLVAYLKAVRQYSQGKTERNIDIIAKHIDLDRDFVKRMCWPPIRQTGQVNTDSVLDFQAWAKERGLAEGTLTTDQIWEPRFLDYALKVVR